MPMQWLWPRAPIGSMARTRSRPNPRNRPRRIRGTLETTGQKPMIAAEQSEEGDVADSGPLRRCLVSRQVRPKAELLRFVVGPEGRLIVDPAERLPGRGLWLTPRRDIVESAVAKGLFAKAAGQRVVVAGELADDVERLLRQRCLALLGLA